MWGTVHPGLERPSWRVPWRTTWAAISSRLWLPPLSTSALRLQLTGCEVEYTHFQEIKACWCTSRRIMVSFHKYIVMQCASLWCCNLLTVCIIRVSQCVDRRMIVHLILSSLKCRDRSIIVLLILSSVEIKRLMCLGPHKKTTYIFSRYSFKGFCGFLCEQIFFNVRTKSHKDHGHILCSSWRVRQGIRIPLMWNIPWMQVHWRVGAYHSGDVWLRQGAPAVHHLHGWDRCHWRKAVGTRGTKRKEGHV